MSGPCREAAGIQVASDDLSDLKYYENFTPGFRPYMEKI